MKLLFLCSAALVCVNSTIAAKGQVLKMGEPCSVLVGKSTSIEGVPFKRQSKPDQVKSFTAVTADFNQRMLVTLDRLRAIHTLREFDFFNTWSKTHDDLCYRAWVYMFAEAKQGGLTSKKWISRELAAQLQIEDARWSELERIALHYHPDVLDDIHPDQ